MGDFFHSIRLELCGVHCICSDQYSMALNRELTHVVY